ncbi:hypothetical protein BC332_10952 [Capsicum chinense]|nr:hypothetical protein BC332_10952 [Capsicum chinense]
MFVGYVIGDGPYEKLLDNLVTRFWIFVAKPLILIHDEGYYLVKFRILEDRDQVLQSGPYYFNNKPLILKEWELTFDTEVLSIITIWVKFLGLPVGHWSTKVLSKMAGAVGKPSFTNKFTANSVPQEGTPQETILQNQLKIHAPRSLLTVIYVSNEISQRKVLRTNLMNISVQSHLPWMKYGDFNSALKSEDRMGSPVTFSEMQGFQGMIDVMQITPLRSKGWHFAWCNKQEGNHRVYCKIDWDFGNYEWIQRFGHVEVEFLNPSGIEKWSRVEEQVIRQKAGATWTECDSTMFLLPFSSTYKSSSSSSSTITSYNSPNSKLKEEISFSDLQQSIDDWQISKHPQD